MLQLNNKKEQNSSFCQKRLQSSTSSAQRQTVSAFQLNVTKEQSKNLKVDQEPFSSKKQKTPYNEQPQHYPNKHTEEDFGFEQQDDHEVVIVQKEQNPMIPPHTSLSLTKKFHPYRMKQPKIKLTFISKQKQIEPIETTLKKQYENKSLQMKKSFQSKSLIMQTNPNRFIHNCVVKVRRNFVGDNLVYTNYAIEENKKIKFQLIKNASSIVYELVRENSTYAHLSLIWEKMRTTSDDKTHKNKGCMTFRTNLVTNNKNKSHHKVCEDYEERSSTQNLKEPLLCSRKQSSSEQSCKNHQNRLTSETFFLDDPLNQLLKSKLKESFVFHKKRQLTNKHQNQDIQFDSEFESGNLEFAARVKHTSVTNQGQVRNFKQNLAQTNTTRAHFHSLPTTLQYNLYLRNDTNTHGHQNWFYFRVKNTSKEMKNIKINVVNLKRNLNLVKDGQRIYMRVVNPFKSQWETAGEGIQVKENKNNHLYKCKVRVLSFRIELDRETEYEVSLLPPYTYSQMLSDLQTMKESKYAKVQTLTYSLIGLAIPIITFTNPQVQDTAKQVILISSRIHPGQTVASFITKGLIESLSNHKDSSTSTSRQVEEFLSSTIVKIIPMINPDGVVFGNFRTNYLGYDLNRSFHTQDEITNPEIVALKELGKKLKNLHGDKFHTFIDLHGHSSEKNIFTYGPDFQNGHENFYKARLLPKLLNSKSCFFKYDLCNFKLQEYKSSTARAFFLNLGVTAFTIESSYAIYEAQNGKNQLLTPKQWLSFGQTLTQSFSLISRLNKTHSIKNRTTLKRAISLSEDENLRLMNKLKKQMKKEETARKRHKERVQKQKGDEDSDGQDQGQDLDANQRQEIEKKMIENTARNVVLPKVFKPSILYPTVTPKIFNIGDTTLSNYKVLYTRRNRYQSIKLPTNTYLHSLQGMDNLKPKARNIKVEKRIQW